MKTTVLFAVGFAVVNGSQVPPVARIVMRFGGLQQLLGGDEAAAERERMSDWLIAYHENIASRDDPFYLANPAE